MDTQTELAPALKWLAGLAITEDTPLVMFQPMQVAVNELGEPEFNEVVAAIRGLVGMTSAGIESSPQIRRAEVTSAPGCIAVQLTQTHSAVISVRKSPRPVFLALFAH